jgi:hypothetical protein
MPLSARTVHDRLHESARRLRWSRSGRYLLLGAAVSVAFLTAGLLLDAYFHFGFTGRWIGFLLVVSPILATVVFAVRAWVVPISECAIARRIESSCGGAQNVLISAVQFDRELPSNSPLRQALFQEMSDPFPSVPWKKVFDLKLIAKIAAALAVALIVMVVWAAISPDRFANSAARLLLPASKVAPLTQTRILEVAPGNATVVHGGELRAVVKLGGELPRNGWIYFREPGSSWQKAVMNREVGAPLFVFTWKEVTQPLEYYIEAGDTSSGAYRVAVRPRTAVKSRNAEMDTPAYMKLGRLSVKDFSALQNVYAGSKLIVTLEFNYPLASLDVTDEKNEAITTKKIEDARWQFTLTAKGSQSLKVTYHDKDDFSDSEQLPITVKPDDPPKIVVTQPAEGQQLLGNPEGALELAFDASDNFSLGAVALYKMTPQARDGELVQEWNDAAGKPTFAARARVPLAKYCGPNDDRVTFFVVARDQNDLTGPGVTFSRPVVVTLRVQDQVKAQSDDHAAKFQKSLEEIVRLQQLNIDDGRTTLRMSAPPAEAFPPMLTRQMEIATLGASLAATTEMISGELRETLRQLSQFEMKEAVLTLRAVVATTGDIQRRSLSRAVDVEIKILSKLHGTPEKTKEDMAKAQIQDMLAGLEELLRAQRELQRDTKGATESAAKELSVRQDKLADKSQKVKEGLEKSIATAPIADKTFKDKLAAIVGMFGELKIHEDMLKATDLLEQKKLADAAAKQQEIILNLTKMIKALNEARVAHGAEEVDKMRKVLEEMKDQITKLEQIQRDIVEKSKDTAKKDEKNPEDVSQAQEIRATKDLMAKVIEQMLTDAHVLPDLTPANEMRATLVAIKEDVKQDDLDDAMKNKLKADEIAVQKEDGIMKALEKAQERIDDMEHWLPNKSDTTKWLCENFDKSEMPQIPNIPLPDSFDDLVGELQKDQQNLAEDAKDANSNQMFQQMPAGWDVIDGPQAGFGAQGKSGNQKPNENEQSGRSSGGRQGMSDGEMAGDTANNLEGSKIDVRRTKDQQQKGMVKDGGEPAETKATGGGKAGAFGDRRGFDGNGPVRESNAPKQQAANAKEVEQALLKDKASKMNAQAKLLFLKPNGLPEVVRLMDESQRALQQGRMRDFDGLHKKIIGQLNTVKGQLHGSSVVALPGADGGRVVERQLAGGDEGTVPAQYKDMVADYYRSLSGER